MALAAGEVLDAPVVVHVDLLEPSTVVEGPKEAKAQTLSEARSLNDVAQPERVSNRLEGPQDLSRVQDGLNEVTIFPGDLGLHRAACTFK